jgi:hypothetical protein
MWAKVAEQTGKKTPFGWSGDESSDLSVRNK